MVELEAPGSAGARRGREGLGHQHGLLNPPLMYVPTAKEPRGFDSILLRRENSTVCLSNVGTLEVAGTEFAPYDFTERAIRCRFS